MNILALGGRMGAGKTTLAQYLRDKYQFHLLSFAAPLKRDIVKMGFPEKMVYVEKPDPIRALMQAYGQAWRHIDKDHWLDLLCRQIEEIKTRYNTPTLFGNRLRAPFIVIDDMRFRNELDAMADLGAHTVRVVKSSPMKNDSFVGVRGDASEMDLNSAQFHSTISAEPGELASLRAQAEDLLSRLGWV